MKWSYPQSYPHLWITFSGKLFFLWKTSGPSVHAYPLLYQESFIHSPDKYAILYPYNLWNILAPLKYNVV